MAGAATATFSTEALTATTGVNGIWELAVPIAQDVGSFIFYVF
jgi:hypothetical protein